MYYRFCMKTIFTNDIDGTRKFFEAVGFVKDKSTVIRVSKTSIPNAVTAGCEYELKDLVEADKPSQVLIQKGIVRISDFFDRLVEEFKLIHVDTVQENAITQTVNFTTPFGFTFHVIVIFA